MRRAFPLSLLALLLLAGRLNAQQFDLRVYGVEDGLPSATVERITEDSAGYLWIGTTGGLCRFDGHRLRPWDVDDPAPPQELHARLEETTRQWMLTPVTDSLIHLRARDGSQWLGSDSGVVLRNTDGRTFHASETNGLGNNMVRCLYQDRSGAIWIGTAFGGVTKFTSRAFMHLTLRDGLTSRTVSALQRDRKDRLWVGTFGGGLAKWDHWRITPLPVPDPFITSLGLDATGNLLVGMAHQGLYRLHGELLLPVAGTAQLRINRIRLMPDSTVWLATSEGVRVLTRDGHCVPAGMQRLSAADLVAAGDSVIVATAYGLFAIPSANSRAQWHPLPQVDPVEATCLQRDGRGNIWIGTAGEGLLRFDGQRSHRVAPGAGLASQHVEQLLLDAYENVWVGTRRGFDMLELDMLQEEVLNTRHFTARDGFIGTEAFRHACWLDSDSALWFGTVRGATRFDPRRAHEDPHPPRVHLQGIDLFYEAVDWSPWCRSVRPDGIPEGLELPHDKNHLTFHFIGLSLAQPERVRYQFTLEGHDPDWSPITSTDQVTYSNLAPGTYTFQVIARNASGAWSEPPVRFTFTIAPPLWRTTGFLAGSASFAALLLLLLVRLRERNLRRDRERLERTVAERTHELADEKHRSEELLLNILPEAVALELRDHGRAQAHRHEHCTVLFSDFTGFTATSEKYDAAAIVQELHRFFQAFDRLTDLHHMEKIKTIGDAYMCAAGVPRPDPQHALNATRMAFAMLAEVERINAERAAEGKAPWPIRIGLHSGPVIAGVVGEKKFAYDIWGATVNLASRMESHSAPGHINASGTTYALVMDHVHATPRGPIKVKGKGAMQMYYLEGWRG
ncbi:MAG: hypothetical protein JNM31_13655 [Flavobacteriales bacterium]|nr:hypothetical protein [Flavobacteriales bacterium]